MRMGEALETFVARQPKLGPTDRAVLVAQALLLVSSFYAHLPRKRSSRGIDPIRRLELLQARLPAIGSDASFHAALCETLAELHDLHTVYLLPGEYGTSVAVLPVALRCCGPPDAAACGRRHRILGVRRSRTPPYAGSGVTPVSSAVRSHSRRAVCSSRAAGLAVARPGAPRVPPMLVGPKYSPLWTSAAVAA